MSEDYLELIPLFGYTLVAFLVLIVADLISLSGRVGRLEKRIKRLLDR